MNENERRDVQIGFRAKASLKAELEHLAKADRRSLASYLEIVLEQHIEAKRKEGKRR